MGTKELFSAREELFLLVCGARSPSTGAAMKKNADTMIVGDAGA